MQRDVASAFEFFGTSKVGRAFLSYKFPAYFFGARFCGLPYFFFILSECLIFTGTF